MLHSRPDRCLHLVGSGCCAAKTGRTAQLARITFVSDLTKFGDDIDDNLCFPFSVLFQLYGITALNALPFGTKIDEIRVLPLVYFRSVLRESS